VNSILGSDSTTRVLFEKERPTETRRIPSVGQKIIVDGKSGLHKKIDQVILSTAT